MGIFDCYSSWYKKNTYVKLRGEGQQGKFVSNSPRSLTSVLHNDTGIPSLFMPQLFSTLVRPPVCDTELEHPSKVLLRFPHLQTNHSISTNVTIARRATKEQVL